MVAWSLAVPGTEITSSDPPLPAVCTAYPTEPLLPLFDKRYITDDIARSDMGEMKLTDIRRCHVSQFTDDLTKAGRGAVTVRRILTLLGTIFASALRMS